MNEQKALDIIQCVGKGYYTYNSFIKEAKRYGACRRIAHIPREVEIGKSRCFLAFEEGEKLQVRAYFVINGIEFIVKKGVDLTKEMQERGVKPISVEDLTNEPERGCGFRHVGALYIVSEEDMEKLRDLAEKTDIQGHIYEINPPIPFPERRFRGFKYVDGDKILNREPFESWFKEVPAIIQLRQQNRCSIANCFRVKDSNSGRLNLCSFHFNIYKRILETGEFKDEWEKATFYDLVKEVK
jgi:hypothetical protein